MLLVQDAEISRLREELGAARAKLSSWEESMIQVENCLCGSGTLKDSVQHSVIVLYINCRMRNEILYYLDFIVNL